MYFKNFLCSSVGKKFLVGLTGLGLSGFVLMHMSGNMLLLVGQDAYNHYAHAMITNPLLLVAELGLIAIFLIHLGLALKLNWENKTARGVGPSQKPSNCDKDARFGSRYMVHTGLLILVFVILHLITFKYGTYYETELDGHKVRDLYRLVAEEFHKPGYVAWYVFSMLILFTHLAHGFSAVFQTLGLGSVRQGWVKKIGWVFAVIVAGGFTSQPIYFYFFQ